MTVSVPADIAEYLRSTSNASAVVREAVAAYRARELDRRFEEAYRADGAEAEQLNRVGGCRRPGLGMNPTLARGAVVLVRFDPAEGREIKKTRPAVVVSNNVACRHDTVVQVVPVTSLPDRELRPYESRCGSSSSGLAHPSRAVANQIRTVSASGSGT